VWRGGEAFTQGGIRDSGEIVKDKKEGGGAVVDWLRTVRAIRNKVKNGEGSSGRSRRRRAAKTERSRWR